MDGSTVHSCRYFSPYFSPSPLLTSKGEGTGGEIPYPAVITDTSSRMSWKATVLR